MAETAAPILDVRGVTLQYKTRDYLVTATYRVDFQVFAADRLAQNLVIGSSVSPLRNARSGAVSL